MTRYYLSNGFHRLTTYILIGEPGSIIPGHIMRRAWRRLCPHKDCTCLSSPGADPTEDQLYDDLRKKLIVEPAYLPDDHDAHIVRSIFNKEGE